jgi:hypothetical protein
MARTVNYDAELARLSARDVQFSAGPESEQSGPFYSLETAIRIILIESSERSTGDPFAVQQRQG